MATTEKEDVKVEVEVSKPQVSKEQESNDGVERFSGTVEVTRTTTRKTVTKEVEQRSTSGKTKEDVQNWADHLKAAEQEEADRINNPEVSREEANPEASKDPRDIGNVEASADVEAPKTDTKTKKTDKK